MKSKKTKIANYDVVIIGAGVAGMTAAQTAASFGRSVCLIEKDLLGGECPNWACIPSKTLIRLATLYYFLKHRLSSFGIKATNINFSFSQMMKRKDAVVETITGKGKKFEKIAEKYDIKIIRGLAQFVDSHTIKVGKTQIHGKSFIIATGSHTYVPPIAGLTAAGYIDFHGVVSLKRQPESVAIVGGGPSACEFATFFAMLGTKVDMFEIGSRILQSQDEEISILAQKHLEEFGIKIHLNTKVLSAKKEGSLKRIVFQTQEKRRQTLVAEKIVIAAGRYAVFDDLKINKAGIKTDARGRLKLSSTLQTNVKNIFAAGDATDTILLTSTANAEGYIAGVNAVIQNPRDYLKRDLRIVPRVVFIGTEVASVGLTSQEAAQQKIKFRVSTFPIGYLGRAVADFEQIGELKLIIEKKTGKILGGHMIGFSAGEVIHQVVYAMKANMTVDDVAEIIHAFPTFAEAVAGASSM